jgi:arylsulfatase A-like enzyme
LDYRRREGSLTGWRQWQPILARCHEHATQVDAAIGQVVDALERLGLMENTLVIYTADHGGILASNGGLVDKGWLMVEETLRIPMAVRWPGQVPAGLVTDALVTNMDLVPTVLEAAQADSPSPMDGTSLLGLLRQPAEVDWREDIMLEHHGHYREVHFQRQLRCGRYKYVAHLNDRDELYDLSQDPYELVNLAGLSRMQGVLTEMRERLHRQMAFHDDDSPWAQQLESQIGFS